jgi:hypothetical protein
VQLTVVVPLQVPAHAPVPAQGAREPRGAPATGTQVPTLPVTLQASHCAPHDVLQHTPSAQEPLRHWFCAVQVVPLLCRGTQKPPVQ